ncbi:hypothetical protein L208DRAFT_1426005 [Tricholoma matsutake]|nr:hypothetical protein L208DRAFT_1426005 [Tricholoma matsutake 945]
MSTRAKLHIPCRCSQCSKAPDGYIYQTRQLICKHTENDCKQLTLRPAPHVTERTTQDQGLSVDLDGPVNANPVFNPAEPVENDPRDNEHYNGLFDDNESPLLFPRINAPSQSPSPYLLPALGIPAFKVKSYIRLAYLQAVMGNVFGKLTWEHATQQLCNSLDLLAIAGQLPLHPCPVQTLQSAKRRLGIDPDGYIIQYIVCSVCWKHYAPGEMDDFATPDCCIPNCPGKLYKLSRDGHWVTSMIVPHDMYNGEMWYRSTIGTRRKVGNHGTICDISENGDAVPIPLYTHQFGLQLILNTDWFGILARRPHSTGPVYWSVNNLPRDLRYLQVNVMCSTMMPGPSEPNMEQLNNCIEPMMDIHGEAPDTIYADCICANCDTPAAHKFNSTAGHSHDFQPCPYCKTLLVDDTILQDSSVRWAVFNSILDWLPSSKTILDFMHNIFLGLIAHFFTCVIFKSYMLSSTGGANSPKQHFENIINSIWWPSHVTQLPKNLSKNQSLKKADEWCHLLTVTPVILWWAWQDENDDTPPSEPVIPPNAKDPPTHSRNYWATYMATLKMCAAISMACGQVGQDFLDQYCLALKQLGIHMTINHHLSPHYLKFIKLFGPVYGWWLFAYKRFNSMLEKVKLNGHNGGCMELTRMHNWVMTHLIYEYILTLPEDAHELEKSYINRIIKTKAHDNRGGMMSKLVMYQAAASVDNNVILPHSLAFISDGQHWVPTEIMSLISVKLEQKSPHICALICRMQCDEHIPYFPWELYASTLGIHTTYTNQFHPAKVVPISRIIINKDLWISVSFDHVCTVSILL